MGVNVEMFFVRTDARRELIDIIQQRLSADPDPAGQQPDWGLPSSYDLLLATEGKRRVAISPPFRGWVAAVESREVLDFALLRAISDALEARVIAIQLSDVTGACGYAVAEPGTTIQSRFSEEDPDPGDTVFTLLRQNGVGAGITRYREAVARVPDGWVIARAG